MSPSSQIKNKREIAQAYRKKGLSLREIGKHLGVSKQRVHQLLEDQHFNRGEFELVQNLKNSFDIKEILGRGWPDTLVVATDGKICAIEVKSDNDRLNSFQKKVCSYLEAAGLPVFISQNGKLNKEIIDYFKSSKVAKTVNIFKMLKRMETIPQLKEVKTKTLEIIKLKEQIKKLKEWRQQKGNPKKQIKISEAEYVRGKRDRERLLKIKGSVKPISQILKNIR